MKKNIRIFNVHRLNVLGSYKLQERRAEIYISLFFLQEWVVPQHKPAYRSPSMTGALTKCKRRSPNTAVPMTKYTKQSGPLIMHIIITLFSCSLVSSFFALLFALLFGLLL